MATQWLKLKAMNLTICVKPHKASFIFSFVTNSFNGLQSDRNTLFLLFTPTKTSLVLPIVHAKITVDFE